MAVAIDNSCLALDFIPQMQERLDHVAGGIRRFQIHRVCAYATILPFDSELWSLHSDRSLKRLVAKQEALDWQADPDDDLGELEVLHDLRKQAAAVPILSNVLSTRDHSNAATILSGSAVSPSIKAMTQGSPLSSFHRHSFRQSLLHLRYSKRSIHDIRGKERDGIHRWTAMAAFLPHVVEKTLRAIWNFGVDGSHDPIVWASSQRADHCRFWQMQVDVIDLFSRRTNPTSRPGKRRRTAFNPFLQVSHSPVVEDPPRGNHLQKYNGVRHRLDRKIWVAEMKPHKHKNKQDFGNFKSEAKAARAVDAAFHHYGRPDRLNFPRTSLQFFSTRPAAPPGLDEKAKVKFVKEEAKLLLAAVAATSPLYSTPTNSLQIVELSASPRRCPSDHFRSFSEISSPFSCSGLDEVDDIVSQPQPWMLLDSICDISTTGVQTNLETLNSMQNAEQGWDWAEDVSTLVAPPNVVNPSACDIQSMWVDSLVRSPPAPTYPRSPSPSHFQEEIVSALPKQQATEELRFTFYGKLKDFYNCALEFIPPME